MQIQEVLRQLDELFATNQIQEAEQFLTEALMQAKEEESQKKSSGEEVLILLNELTGYYRSVGRHEEAVQNAREALEQIRKLGMSESAEHGTTLVNAATAQRGSMKLRWKPTGRRSRSTVSVFLPKMQDLQGFIII